MSHPGAGAVDTRSSDRQSDSDGRYAAHRQGSRMTEDMKNVADLVSALGTFVFVLALLSIFNVPFPGPTVIIASPAMASEAPEASGLGLVGLGIGAALFAAPSDWHGRCQGECDSSGWQRDHRCHDPSLGPAISYAVYGDLQGNLPRLALLLIISWTSAGLGEEMLFRGFFLT
jgi:hypothetical protein